MCLSNKGDRTGTGNESHGLEVSRLRIPPKGQIWVPLEKLVEKLIHFLEVIKFVGVNLILIFNYYPLNVFRIYSDGPLFIPDILNL